MWTPSSPNLNPLDYHAWRTVEDNACAQYPSNVTALKASIAEHWNTMPKDILEYVYKRFRSRIEQCIAAEGGVFEKWLGDIKTVILVKKKDCKFTSKCEVKCYYWIGKKNQIGLLLQYQLSKGEV